jgi:DNA-binding response OmpR family regulator
MKKVLFIEPNTMLADIYVSALEQHNLEAKYCCGAEQGITLMDSFAPDVVVMELQLVAHDGIEFLQELRSYPEWVTVPVIILTNTSPQAVQPLRQALQRDLGVRDILYKPRTQLSSLVALVRRYCS